jgi:hypothetical protein
MNREEGKRRGTRIEVVGEINQSIVYANFAKVLLTPYEGVITFARVDPATAAAQGDEETAAVVDAPAVARIALPHAVIAGLYRAIGAQVEKRPELGLRLGDEE